MTLADYLSLIEGAGMTVLISLSAIVLGVPLGLGLALLRWGRVPVAGHMAAVYVSIIRASPMVTLGLLIFFALPGIGLSLDPIPAGIATLTISTASFNAEIWRGALLAFPKDQIESAKAVGMTRGLWFRRIVLPQVTRTALPALVNEMTLLLKSSPAIAVLGVVEITRAAVRIGARTYEPLPPFAAALVIYTAVIALFVLAQRMVERRYGVATATR
ncbi:amino acid ABC transporter permease [Zavarzinia sp. CC-PAN008]|uniref:amino acid ABC transporter permease n=1 Tax=Zavarzinia sp. CC-PAN008 TaxID=3243332 RepID=UPI003F74438C